MLFLFSSLLLAAPADWDVISTINGIEVSRKMESSGLYAFRGEAIVDVHISKLVTLQKDESLGKEWVDMMVFSKKIKEIDANTTIIHQGYDIAWPVDDRDYVFRKELQYDASKKQVTVLLSSVEVAEVPPQKGYVRAFGERTFWLFEAQANGKTKIIVEVVTDPKGSMPGWLVNSVQADWPNKTIRSLVNRAQKGDLRADSHCSSW